MQLFGKTKFKKITNFALNLKWKKFRKRTKMHFRIIWIERIPLLQVYFSYFIAKQGRIFKDICIKESSQFCSACSSSGLIYYGPVSSSFRRKRPRANYFIIPGGNFPRGQLSPGGIVWGEIFLGGNYPRGQLSARQFSSGAIVLEHPLLCLKLYGFCLKKNKSEIISGEIPCFALSVSFAIYFPEFSVITDFFNI